MTALLEISNVSKQFGGVAALRDVAFVQNHRETLGMIGPNGSGKTTFINVVSGHLRANTGHIRLDGRDISGARPHRIVAHGLVRTYQAVRLFFDLSVSQNLAASTLMLRGTPAESGLDEELRALCEWLRLDHRLAATAGGLTLFEQRRLELAMRLIQKPSLIMLDEPVGGLAPSEIGDMMEVLQEAKGRCTLFVIEHTMKVIRELADRVVVLVAGEKIADGPPAEILRDKRVLEEYLGTADA
jgi:ABC-type branched-subunit amino acid transport system ATPase component